MAPLRPLRLPAGARGGRRAERRPPLRRIRPIDRQLPRRLLRRFVAGALARRRPADRPVLRVARARHRDRCGGCALGRLARSVAARVELVPPERAAAARRLLPGFRSAVPHHRRLLDQRSRPVGGRAAHDLHHAARVAARAGCAIVERRRHAEDCGHRPTRLQQQHNQRGLRSSADASQPAAPHRGEGPAVQLDSRQPVLPSSAVARPLAPRRRHRPTSPRAASRAMAARLGRPPPSGAGALAATAADAVGVSRPSGSARLPRRPPRAA
mmetsp:Transcript_92755/g.278278  ORF Transcript_92755/g.278278 Transcript_92755/m.278278 type:complete len:269 (+) Transcript_92755:163-969(+)